MSVELEAWEILTAERDTIEQELADLSAAVERLMDLHKIEDAKCAHCSQLASDRDILYPCPTLMAFWEHYA